MKSKIIVLAKAKGGVAATTTALNLAAGILATSPRATVRLVDIDPQETLWRFRAGALDKRRAAFRHGRVGELPALVEGGHDFTIVDCPQFFNPVTHEINEVVTALLVAGVALLPVAAEHDAVIGFARTVQLVEQVQAEYALPLRVHILVTMHTASAAHCRAERAKVVSSYPAETVRFAVPWTRQIGAAASAGKSVVEFAPRSGAARAYLKLANEVVNKWDFPES